MQKIKFDPWLTLLIVLVLVAVFYAFHRYCEEIKDRVDELKSEIKDYLTQLEIEIERQEMLVKQAVRVYRLIATLLFTLLFSSIALAIYLGIAYNEALENVVGTAGLVLAMITVVFHQTFNPDVLLRKLKDQVVLRVFKRNGFDPEVIFIIKKNIERKETELVKLEYQPVEL